MMTLKTKFQKTARDSNLCEAQLQGVSLQLAFWSSAYVCWTPECCTSTKSDQILYHLKRTKYALTLCQISQLHPDLIFNCCPGVKLSYIQTQNLAISQVIRLEPSSSCAACCPCAVSFTSAYGIGFLGSWYRLDQRSPFTRSWWWLFVPSYVSASFSCCP